MYADLRQHIANLEKKGLLRRVKDEINKDTEMHPLVRWQYRGGIAEKDRKAWLFENVVGSRGEHYAAPVLVGGLAGTPEIYAVGVGVPVDEIGDRWAKAFSDPVPPVEVKAEDAPVQEVVCQGKDLEREGMGFDMIPVPISTPGFDNAPYLTSVHAISRDPETGVPNMGNYRSQIKGKLRAGLYFTPLGQDIHAHWEKARAKGENLPVALVMGAPPVCSYAAVTKVPPGLDELTLAGGLAGEPIRVVKAKTADLLVPADAEIVIEGVMHTDYLEPEGPYGESHGYVHPRALTTMFEVTCITYRKDFIATSFISQVTPSESSVIKKVGYEPLLYRFLTTDIGVRDVVGVKMHEPLTNLRPVIFVKFKKNPNQGEVWRALKATSSFIKGGGKIVIALDEDIDPENADAVLWALAYRMRPHRDVQIVRGYDKAHAPPFTKVPPMENSVLLINATLRDKFPPVSLPTKKYMEDAKKIWERMGFPDLKPEAPWFGYDFGFWPEELAEEADLATQGRYYETGDKLEGRRISPDEGVAGSDLL